MCEGVKGVFWNARGLSTKSDELIGFMEERGLGFAGISESKSYKEDLSKGNYKWLKGPELPPGKGGVVKRGLGMLINMEKLPGAHVVGRGTNTMWVCVPGLRKLFIGVAYCPEKENKAAMVEAVEGLRSYENKGIAVCGGDYNARCALNGDTVINTNGKRLIKLCRRNNLVVANGVAGIASGEFTRTEQRLGKTVESTLDYVILPQQHVPKVASLEIVSDTGLRSDHKPVVVALHVKGRRSANSTERKAKVKKLCANQATEANWDRFEQCMDPVAMEWMALVGDGTIPVTDLYPSLCRAITAAADHTIGSKMMSAVPRYVPDRDVWKCTLKCKDAATSLNNCAQVDKAKAREALATARRALKVTARRAKRARNANTAKSLNESRSDPSKLWELLGRLSSQQKSSLPDMVRKPDGSLVFDHAEGLKVWKDFAEELGKSAPIMNTQVQDQSDRRGADRKKFDDVFAQRILLELDDISLGGGIPELDKPVEPEEVHVALTRLKMGKAQDLDGLVNEVLVYAGIGASHAIALLFNRVWESGSWPEEWQRAYLCPCYKDGSELDPANYRLLAVMASMAKLFEKVVDTRLRTWVERMGVLSDAQGGFRENRGTLDQIFVLNEIVAMQQEKKSLMLLAFLDVRKAYDKVWRDGLWVKLSRLGVGGRCLQLLRLMYARVIRTVKVNGTCTEDFEVHDGVAQGSVLSPMLYAVYIDGLTAELEKQGCGVLVFGRRVACLLYADDIVMLARSGDDLDCMLAIADDYSRKWRFEFNSKKSNVVVIGTTEQKGAAARRSWVLGGDSLLVVPEYKYLGVETGKKRGRWQSCVSRLTESAQSVLNLMMWRSKSAVDIEPRVQVQRWLALCRPILEYACELWHGMVPPSVVAELESVQLDFCRTVLRLRKSSASAAGLRAELGLISLAQRRSMLKMGYWAKLCNAGKGRLLHHVFTHRHSEIRAGLAPLSCLNAFKDVMQRLGLESFWESRAASAGAEWRARVTRAGLKEATQEEQVLFKRQESLAWYRQLGHSFTDGVAPYLWDPYNRTGTHLLTRCRLGQLGLGERRARFAGRLVLAVCPLCGAKVEDFQHFLCECPRLKRCREELLGLAVSLTGSMGSVGSRLQQIMLSGHVDFVKLVLCGDMCPLLCRVRSECAEANWSWFKMAKNFVLAMWRSRTRLVSGVVQPLRAPRVGGRSLLVPRDAKKLCRLNKQVKFTISKRKSPYYVVLKGRECGIFYKWSECRRSVYGVKDPQCWGVANLDEALGSFESVFRDNLPRFNGISIDHWPVTPGHEQFVENVQQCLSPPPGVELFCGFE